MSRCPTSFQRRLQLMKLRQNPTKRSFESSAKLIMTAKKCPELGRNEPFLANVLLLYSNNRLNILGKPLC
jgi:hypothetical protein